MPTPDRFTVLVVEDEPLLLLAAADMVEEAGFTVVLAADADEAIALLETRDDIRLVFTDIDLPGSMDGLRLAAAVRDRWPPVHIIMTSGHCTPASADMPEGAMFFSKPYDDRSVTEAMLRLAV